MCHSLTLFVAETSFLKSSPKVNSSCISSPFYSFTYLNSWCSVNKLHEKQHNIHHTPMLSSSYSLQCNHLCNRSMHGYNKEPLLFCSYAHPLCVIRVFKRKKKEKKTMEKKEKRKPKIN